MTQNDAARVTAPQPGQTWVPRRPGSRAKARVVTWWGRVPGLRWDTGTRNVGFLVDGDVPRFSFGAVQWSSWLGLQSWRAWVRKHDAHPVDAATEAPNA